jgi:ABC-type arginine transport system ATPase subunit
MRINNTSLWQSRMIVVLTLEETGWREMEMQLKVTAYKFEATNKDLDKALVEVRDAVRVKSRRGQYLLWFTLSIAGRLAERKRLAGESCRPIEGDCQSPLRSR